MNADGSQRAPHSRPHVCTTIAFWLDALCESGADLPAAVIREPRWHRTARAAFTVLFFLVWLEAVSCFVFFMILSKNGSPVPTPELSASVSTTVTFSTLPLHSKYPPLLVGYLGNWVKEISRLGWRRSARQIRRSAISA